MTRLENGAHTPSNVREFKRFATVIETSSEVSRRVRIKVVVAYWKVKTPCHAHGECIN